MWWKGTRVWPPQFALRVNDASTGRIWQESVPSAHTDTTSSVTWFVKKNKTKQKRYIYSISPSKLRGRMSLSGGLRCLGRLGLSPVVFSEECQTVARRPSLSVITGDAPAGGGSRLFTRHITRCRCSAKRGGFTPSHKNTATRRRRKREGRHGSQRAQRELTSDPAAKIAFEGGRKKKSPLSNRQLRQFVSHRLSGQWTATALQFPVAKRPEEASTRPSVAW